MNSQTKVIFLDRDGVINIDKSYVCKIEDFEFVDGVFEVLRYFQSLGYALIVVTNQSGIGRGYYSSDDFEILTSYMIKELKKENITISKVYHSPYLPTDNSSCRKPNPGMLMSAKEEFDIDMSSSWMIGDKKSDIEAGQNAGVGKTIFIGKEVASEATFSVNSILDIIDLVT